MTHPKHHTAACLLAALLISAVGCSGWPTPSQEEAVQTLRQAPQFTSTSITRTLSLYERRCIWPATDETHSAWVTALGTMEQEGVITVTRRPATAKECGLPNGELLTITLTDAGKQASTQWPNRPVNDDLRDPNYLPTWNVPLRQRRLVDVTGIGAPDSATGQVPVDFTWELVGLHDDSVVQNRATGMFEYEKAGWRMKSVTGLGDR
jgi:hypothetical protein